MNNLVVDVPAITAAGSGIRTASQLMPEPTWGPACASGSNDVDAALDRLAGSVGRQMLGGAAEMFRIGQGAVNAAAVYRSTDATL